MGDVSDVIRSLKAGDLIERRCGWGGRWHLYRVEGRPYLHQRYEGEEGEWHVRIRKEGTTSAGHPNPSTVARPHDGVRLAVKRDPVTANVFADFLEERGEYRAAALLRAAFPLAGGEG